MRQIEAAEEIVVTAMTPAGPAPFLIGTDRDGMRICGYRMVDGGRGGELHLDRTPARLIGAVEDGRRAIADALSMGTCALCWEAIGIMDQMRDATLDYMRTRTQFGKPIGSFQALQHRMATVAIEIEQARSATINAAAVIDADIASAEMAVSAAKYTIGRAGALVTEEAIQIHGGIAMTWELPLSRYAKRLLQIGQEMGDEDYHLARYMALDAAA